MINNNIFQSIKNALSKDTNNSSLGEIIKMEPGNTYTVRLLPAKDADKTFFHYYQHGWNSFANGQYVGALSLQTFGERDPIAEERYRIIRTGSDADKKKAETIKRAEKWLVNVYVVNDPVTPENNGKVKIMRYGKQLHTIIQDAISGESAEDFGPRVFDLGPNGVNLKVKVEKQGEYPSYVTSKFAMPSEIKDLTEEKAKKVYESVFDLTKVFQVRSTDELKQMLAEHFYCVDTKATDDVEEEAPVVKPVAKVQSKPEVKPAAKRASVDDEDEVEKLLADLDVNS
jgi:hypothetical protein